MISVIDHVRDNHGGVPWLVLGKGPSAAGAASRPRLLPVLALNHACLAVQADVAHFSDWEAFLDCYPRLGTAVACLPWRPHVNFQPSRKHNLLELLRAAGIPEDRVVSYNSSRAAHLPRNRQLPDVPVRFFSAVAAFNILGLAGVRYVHTLGVDGGKAYAPEFDQKDRLANGRQSFDVQFPEIRRACKRYRIQWTDLAVKGK
jgi:hypothetical protein